MARILQHEIDRLKKDILALGGVVEEAVRRGVKAVDSRDVDLARELIASDSDIDTREVELEEECLKILALHQPVAIDLRLIVSILKINNDLERIGDLATNIAERALALSEYDLYPSISAMGAIAEKAQSMLRRSLDAFVNLDTTAARQVCEDDDEVDEIHAAIFREIQDAIRRTPEHIEPLISQLSVSRYLERIADHATNIAEDVIYMIEGDIVRHQVTAADTGT